MKRLREGETGICDCCGAELSAYVVETPIGTFGVSCWKTIRTAARYLRNAIQHPLAYEGTPESAEAKINARYPARVVHFIRRSINENHR